MTTTTKPKTCVHHWVIDPPNGRYSEGVCQKCGQVREFDNFPDTSQWPDKDGE